MEPCVLSVGCSANLMSLRTLLLQGAGYVVDEAYEVQAARVRAQCDSVDAVLICHTIAKNQKRWLIAKIREKRRLVPILCLTAGIHEMPSDGSIAVENDPGVLLNALQLALKHPRSESFHAELKRA